MKVSTSISGCESIANPDNIQSIYLIYVVPRGAAQLEIYHGDNYKMARRDHLCASLFLQRDFVVKILSGNLK